MAAYIYSARCAVTCEARRRLEAALSMRPSEAAAVVVVAAAAARGSSSSSSSSSGQHEGAAYRVRPAARLWRGGAAARLGPVLPRRPWGHQVAPLPSQGGVGGSTQLSSVHRQRRLAAASPCRVASGCLPWQVSAADSCHLGQPDTGGGVARRIQSPLRPPFGRRSFVNDSPRPPWRASTTHGRWRVTTATMC